MIQDFSGLPCANHVPVSAPDVCPSVASSSAVYCFPDVSEPSPQVPVEALPDSVFEGVGNTLVLFALFTNPGPIVIDAR